MRYDASYYKLRMDNTLSTTNSLKLETTQHRHLAKKK